MKKISPSLFPLSRQGEEGKGEGRGKSGGE